MRLCLYNQVYRAKQFPFPSRFLSIRRFQLAPYASFEELAGPEHPALAAELRRLYGDDVEAVEFVPGLYLEKRRENGMFGETIIEMGAPASVTGMRESR